MGDENPKMHETQCDGYQSQPYLQEHRLSGRTGCLRLAFTQGRQRIVYDGFHKVRWWLKTKAGSTMLTA